MIVLHKYLHRRAFSLHSWETRGSALQIAKLWSTTAHSHPLITSDDTDNVTHTLAISAILRLTLTRLHRLLRGHRADILHGEEIFSKLTGSQKSQVTIGQIICATFSKSKDGGPPDISVQRNWDETLQERVTLTDVGTQRRKNHSTLFFKSQSKQFKKMLKLLSL